MMKLCVDPQRLGDNLRAVAGERSPFSAPDRLAEVELFIERRMAGYGLDVRSDHFTFRGRTYRNVIGTIGAQVSDALIILGAHFDSVQGTSGADDNASGVAVLLEAARVIAGAGLQKSVLFCAFQLEELNMIGSSHFARSLKRQGARIRGMVSLEMVGYTDRRPGCQRYPAGLGWLYPSRGDFIAVIGNWSSHRLLRRFARSMRRVDGLPVETLSLPGKGRLLPAARLSDHSPFWDLGYPALLITDTAFLRNPHYHRASDTIETLDMTFMVRVCDGVIRAVQEL